MIVDIFDVAPFAGAWIEIVIEARPNSRILVAPFAGAWIEIAERNQKITKSCVAPFAGGVD